MALSDGLAGKVELAQSQQVMERYREARKRALELERARTSEPRTFTDDKGIQWDYVVLDGDKVRLEKCTTDQSIINIPSSVEGLPVRAIASDCIMDNFEVEEIICPETVELVAPCAFRNNKRLRRLVLPPYVTKFDSSWFRNCANINELVLPGGVESIDQSVFDAPGLKILTIGPATREIAPGAFDKSQLARVEISDDNPYLVTDGKAIYSRDGERLVVLAVPQSAWDVPEGCKVVCKKAFMGKRQLEKITLPEGLEVLEPFALARTNIEEIVLPSSMRDLGEKAFFFCRKLKSVQLNEGLLSIGDGAFTSSGVEELVLPSTLESVGYSIAEQTKLNFKGEEATVKFAPGAKTFELDCSGGLYRLREEGRSFERLLDDEATDYAVQAGTVAIEPRAFARHKKINTVRLPDGLEVIGEAAFKDCAKLETIVTPKTLKRIEDEAFLDTNITSIYIPAGLERIGRLALATYGAHRGNVAPSLREVIVASDNPRYYTVPGLLMQNLGNDKAMVVVAIDSCEDVTIPTNTFSIAPYAMNNVRNIKKLTLGTYIKSIETRGMSVNCLIEHLHIDLEKPYEGHDHFDLYFPDTDRSLQQINLAFSTSSYVDVRRIVESYDDTIINVHNFDARRAEGLPLYDQTVRIIERLKDPVYMQTVTKNMCDTIIKSQLNEICVEIARHDDRKAIDDLVDLGYITKDNLVGIIERVGNVQDAAMTGYLLEVQRRYFKQSSFMDFDL